MIVEPKELATVRHYAGPDAVIGLRLGCYDLLHEGHFDGIEFAKSQSDILVVGISPDIVVRRRKGSSRPRIDENTRANNMDLLPQVDFTFIRPESAIIFGRALINLHPDIYIEHEHSSSRLKASLVQALGVRYIVDTGPKLNSTTNLIRQLEAEGQAA